MGKLKPSPAPRRGTEYGQAQTIASAKRQKGGLKPEMFPRGVDDLERLQHG